MFDGFCTRSTHCVVHGDRLVASNKLKRRSERPQCHRKKPFGVCKRKFFLSTNLPRDFG